MRRDAPLIQAARRACEAARHPKTGSPARQIVAVYVFADGTYAVASYGATKAECAAIRPTCDAIADAIEEGSITLPVRRTVDPCYATLDGDPRPCGLPRGHDGEHRP